MTTKDNRITGPGYYPKRPTKLVIVPPPIIEQAEMVYLRNGSRCVASAPWLGSGIYRFTTPLSWREGCDATEWLLSGAERGVSLLRRPYPVLHHCDAGDVFQCLFEHPSPANPEYDVNILRGSAWSFIPLGDV